MYYILQNIPSLVNGIFVVLNNSHRVGWDAMTTDLEGKTVSTRRKAGISCLSAFSSAYLFKKTGNY